jgi:2,3-bisphosphoglycerate-independent phosphoglycerate mutase
MTMLYTPKAHPIFGPPSGPVVLCILDGIGLGSGGEDDAVATAHTPNLDRYFNERPWLSLTAHGTAVGLPSDQDMGNSEVGHNALGAGRVFDQGAKLVDQSLASGHAFQGEVWQQLVSRPTLHLLGLVSDGNVHSHIRHLFTLIDQAATDGVQRLRVHGLTDGRDVGARTAIPFFQTLSDHLQHHRKAGRDYQIASGGGRMHLTMDRYEADWAMVERGWRCHVAGEGRAFDSAVQAIQCFYDDDENTDDQWLPAFVVADENGPVGRILDNDAVLFFNFRGDRAIEISRAFSEPDFSVFPQPNRPAVYFAGMMQYDGDTQTPAHFLVDPPVIEETVGEVLIAGGLRSYVVSETQKYGHVTFFFNGNRSGLIDPAYETYHEIPSDNIPFDQAPQMKAREITDAAIAAIGQGVHHVRLNLPNGDMVGHTGNLAACRVAVETVDRQLARLEMAVGAAGGVLLITADHGNADEMYLRKGGVVLTHPDGRPLARTAHSLNPVPFIVIDPSGKRSVIQSAASSIAAVGTTVIELCGLQAPEGYLPGLVQGREHG